MKNEHRWWNKKKKKEQQQRGYGETPAVLSLMPGFRSRCSQSGVWDVQSCKHDKAKGEWCCGCSCVGLLKEQDSLSLWKSGAISFEYMATDCLPFSDFWPDGNHLVTPSMIFNRFSLNSLTTVALTTIWQDFILVLISKAWSPIAYQCVYNKIYTEALFTLSAFNLPATDITRVELLSR